MVEQKLKEEIESLIQEFGETQSALLPVLQAVQSSCGCVPEDHIQYISERLNIPVVEVYSVLSFYGMFKVKKEGKFVIKLCNSLSCYLKGGKSILETLKKELGIGPGEKTQDGLFSIELVGCLGLCDKSPAMLINEKEYTNLTEEKVRDIINAIKEKGGV